MAGRKDQAAGTVKKTVGKATGNKGLQTEGAAQEAAGKVKTKINDLGQTAKGIRRGAKESLSKKNKP
ncbi:MAG TPA: CsbD family protein [Candidatus Dormibacteraeota bacterium]|nr:CsbD family protein [Candidatus Dormibacteraeota bacterium]